MEPAIPDIEDLIQDYMALILFPTNDDVTLYASREERVKVVESHLYQWGQRKLPHPIQSHNTLAIIDLLSLHSRLQLYIEDFLGKATHPWIRRSYRYIPHWAHVDFSQDFSNLSLEKDGFDCSYDIKRQLSSQQRRRVFRCFLRYELLCKIYSPQKGKLLIPPVRPPKLELRDQGCPGEWGSKEPSYLDSLGKVECRFLRRKWNLEEWFDPDNPYRHWDWNILERYEGSPTSLCDKRLFVTIREYISLVYVALLRNEKQVPIPFQPLIMPGASLKGWGQTSVDRGWDIPRPIKKPSKEVRRRLRKMGDDVVGYSRNTCDLLTTTGFDVLTAVLLNGRNDFQKLLHNLGEEIQVAQPNSDLTNIIHSLNAPCEECGVLGLPSTEKAYLKKQLAWAVFNEPPDPEPVDRTEELSFDEGKGFDHRPEAFCNHTSICGMTGAEHIYHAAGSGVYPSLASRMVRFWKRWSDLT